MKLNFHKNHNLLFGVVFWGFVFLSLIIAVFPAVWVQDKNEPLPGSQPMTALEKKGLDVFVSEGCMYCHTQQVRPLEMDKMWGRPSAPGDYARIGRQDVWRQTPAVLGSARTGPDLSSIGTRQPSDVWHYMHMYNPRSVVKESIMPSYPWLFEVVENPADDDVTVTMPEGFGPDEGTIIATPKAKALIAYLQSLKQGSLEDNSNSNGSDNAGNQTSSAEQTSAKGATIYSNNCASCHQQNGEGLTGVFPPLAGNSVTNADDPTEHIQVILYGLQGRKIDGVEYASVMQAFESILSDEEVAAVINHERTSWGNDAPTVTADQVKQVRNNKNLTKLPPN